MKVQKIDPYSLARVVGMIMFFIGLILGVLYSFGGLVIDLTTIGINAGTGLAFGALIGMPLIAGIPGFFVGWLIAILYNVTARLVGGLELDLKK